MALSCLLGITRSPARKHFSRTRCHINNPLLHAQACSVKIAGLTGQILFCVMELESVLVHKHAKINLAQYPAIFTACLVNNPCLTLIIKFSTSDNAILAFWLVHWISVTSHYTCVWPYMEMNAVNVARHKLFRGKPSFVEKNMDEKKQIRWAIYGRNTGNYGQCHPSNNKKATKFEIRLFNGTYTLSFLEKLQN